MASLVSENFSCVNEEVEYNGIDALKISLLEESLAVLEDHNDEQLNRVIKSLEAEINPRIVLEGSAEGDQDNDQSFDGGHVYVHDCLESDFQWAYMEHVPSSPSDDMNWYMEVEGVEFGGMNTYGHDEMCYGISLEDQYYSSLWHENNETLMYN